MTISQKCNCCMHEDVCSKKVQYESTCNRISSAVDYSEKDLLMVNVKCAHFIEKSGIKKGGVE